MTRDKLKLEELKKRLCKRLTQPQDVLDVYNISVLSHAEGVVEGAGQMKETIRDNSLHYRQFDKMEPNIVAGEHNDCAFAQEDVFVVLASVLAPTKEEK